MNNKKIKLIGIIFACIIIIISFFYTINIQPVVIGEILFTLSNKMIKMNSLDNLKEINYIKLK